MSKTLGSLPTNHLSVDLVQFRFRRNLRGTTCTVTVVRDHPIREGAELRGLLDVV